MDNSIPEFNFSDILLNNDESIMAEIHSPKVKSSKKKDPQLVHLLKKVNLQTTFLSIIIPLFCLWKIIFSKPMWNEELVIFFLGYFILSEISLVAGYHRLFCHNAFQCHIILEFFMAFLGASCGLGSILDFCSEHMAHHHYIDTERDPHSCSLHGWLFAQWGHKLFLGNRKSRKATKECRNTIEVSARAMNNKNDTNQYIILSRYKLLKWQDINYIQLWILTNLLIPGFVAEYYCTLPYFSGIFYLGLLRMSIIQQQWLSIGSICHIKKFPFATQPFDDSKSSINLPLGILGQFLTFGESNHNFHHEFPGDYRNGIEWYSFDPVKWIVFIWYQLGWVCHLHRASCEQLDKCLLQQQQKLLDKERSKLQWGIPIDKLPLMSPESFVKLAKHEYMLNNRALVAIEGIVHDVTPFIHEHPGGVSLVKVSIGKDATEAFNGAVYRHSRAARNLLATMRIAVLGNGPMEIQNTVWERHLLESTQHLKNDSKGQEIIRNREQVTFIRKNHYAAGAA